MLKIELIFILFMLTRALLNTLKKDDQDCSESEPGIKDLELQSQKQYRRSMFKLYSKKCNLVHRSRLES